MKNYIALILALITGTASANEFRVPVLKNIHAHDFDPHESNGWRVQVDSSAYTRQADRAFKSSHGTATSNLTALFFNKDSFRLSNVFPDCSVPYATELYNPYMRVISIAPRASYYEEGVQVGLDVSQDVFKEKGRWGVRVRVPFKVVTINRTDAGSRRDSQTEDVVRKAKNEATGSNLGFGYRLDFLEAMPNQDMVTQQVVYANGTDKYIDIFGGDTRSNKAAAVYAVEGHAPRSTHTGVLQTAVSATTVPANLEGMSEETIYAFGQGSYGPLSDTAAADGASRAANQDKKAAVWVVSTHDGSGDMPSGSASEKISSAMKDLLQTFNTSAYEWLYDRGYTLDSSKQMGMGDVDLSLYYDHMINDRAVGGVELTAKLPTAYGSQYNDNNYAGNPYRAHLGNGGHFEVGGGAHLDCEAFSWLNWHVDGCYLFALDSTEWRCATPSGSLIKNIGPKHEASVSWSSFVGNAELHVCHPHTTDITGNVGYQIYYKTTDTIKFKNKTVDHWLGRSYNTTANDFTAANTMTLDNKLAAANSEQWAHRLRLGLSYHFSDWFTASAGSVITFAGQNVPKTFEWQMAFRVTL